jgi:two-component system, LytTR family, response regulator LytT
MSDNTLPANANVLIVEDEFIIAETIAEILANAGCQHIRIVASVAEAITEIELHKPTIVLTDINLGQAQSGIDLGEVLHTKYRIPFIYITSHSSPDILNKAKHTRPNAYIVKPFKNQDLLVAIALALFNVSEDTMPTITTHELIIKEGRAIVKLDCTTITYVETEGNYTTIYLHNTNRRVVRIPLAELQQQLPTTVFVRIHKSYLINTNYVTQVNTSSIIINSIELPIGRTHQQEVHRLLKK